jgi:hypothetical protein
VGTDRPVRSRPDDRAVLGTYVGAAFGGIGFLLLSVVVYAGLVDPYGLTTLRAIGLLAIGIALLTAVIAAVIARQLVPAVGLVAAVARAAIVLSGSVVATSSWWMLVSARSDERVAASWALGAPALAAVVGAVAAVGMLRDRSGVAAVALVAGPLAVFGWGIATVIAVNLTWSPLPVRAGQSVAHVEFDAMVSGTYDVRVGAAGCSDGRVVATGRYGPGWDEASTGIDRARVDIPRAALSSGPNTIRICVRDGIRLGRRTVVIDVDEIAPQPPTLVAEPVTHDGASAIAMTRSLRFSGTAEPGSQLEIRLDGNEFSKPRVVDGRWTARWQFASATEHVSVEVVARDRAGNESHAKPLAIRFESDDPPAVFSEAYPTIAIECRERAAGLTPTACRDWGVVALDAQPQLVPSIVRVVLTDDAEGCAAILVGHREVMVSYDRAICPPGV